MKKLLLALVLLVSITASAQSLQKYTRGLKLTTAEINAIDTTRTDVVYRAYNTDLGIEIINRRDNQGWVPLVTAGGITDAQIAAGFLNIYPNADLDSTDDFSGDYNDLTNKPSNAGNGEFNNVTVGQADGQSGGMMYYHPNTLNAPFGNGNMGQGRTFFNGDNFGFMPPDAQFEGYQFVGIPTEIVDIILPTSGTVDLTNIGSGSGGTDDQTLPEVLTEGNDAGGEDVLNVGILNLSDKNSDTGTWDITEQTSSTYSGDLAFRNSSAGSSINRAFIPHDGIIEHSAHLTTKLYVDQAITNSIGSDSGQGWYLNNVSTTDGEITYSNSNVTQNGSANGKRVWNRHGNATVDISAISMLMNSYRIQSTKDSVVLKRPDSAYFITEDSIIKNSDYVAIKGKSSAYVTHLTDSSGIDLIQVDVSKYLAANFIPCDPFADNPNPNLNTGNASAYCSDNSNNLKPQGTASGQSSPLWATTQVVADTSNGKTNYVMQVTQDNSGNTGTDRNYYALEVGVVYQWELMTKGITGSNFRWRFESGSSDTTNRFFSNTDWVTENGEFTATANIMMHQVYATNGSGATGDKVQYLFILKKKNG